MGRSKLMRRWRRTGARAAVGFAVVAVLLTPGSPADAGHINKGEGHGPPDPTLTVVTQPTVTGPTAAGSCAILFEYRFDGAKGKIVVRFTDSHTQDVTAALFSAGRFNGETRAFRTTHPDDDHSFTYIIQLVSNKNVLLDEVTTESVTSDC